MCGSLLARLRTPAPDLKTNDAFNREVEREYDRHELHQSVQTCIALLTHKKKKIYETLMKAIDDGNGGLFVLDCPAEQGRHSSCY